MERVVEEQGNVNGEEKELRKEGKKIGMNKRRKRRR